MAGSSTSRVARDLVNIQKSNNLSLAVDFRDSDLRSCTALVVGPPGTPYNLGFFEFSFKFPNQYPQSPPAVKCITTDGGRTRFNPNIYAEGKVCLSILGTWQGERGEQWSPCQSLETTLISIQSLMSSNPWVNEPGFEEDSEDSEVGGLGRYKDNEAKAYSAKIHHETINITVLKRLESYLGIPTPTAQAEHRTAIVFSPPKSGDEKSYEPFEDLCKRRFLWYYTAYHDSISEAIKTYGDLVKDGKKMQLTPFESSCNGMSGTFNYTSLKKRLEAVRDALNNEAESWIQEGADLVERESPLALAAQNMFKNMPQKVRDSSKCSGSTLDFELVDDNPFVWRLILFGQPMTNLDEGIFKIKIVFTTRFPEEQPRVTVETPIFHHRVSPDGVLAYIPANPADHKSHIEAIVEALVGDTPCPDCFMSPNPEASDLLWGTPEQRKMYARKLRRSAQQSSDY